MPLCISLIIVYFDSSTHKNIHNFKMFVAATIFVLLSTTGSSTSNDNLRRRLPPSLQDEVNMKVPEIIQKYKYPVEVHEVITDDGYILTLHRIPNRNNSQISRGAVLLMHGILASSADWIITGPKNGLGYILADEGYDVWLGNARGNRYSRRHVSIDPDSKKFWDFSWHEIGYFDVPAKIDYITRTTNESKIFHIGHSQGTTTFYVMAALRPEYNERIRAHISLAPVAYVNHMTSPIMQVLSKSTFLLKPVAKFIGLNEFLPKDGYISEFGQKMCGVNEITRVLCTNTLFAICGFNYKQMNETILPLILAHVPAGSSTKQLLHYAQEINSGKFRQYDYGYVGNWRRYSSWKPPQYEIENISAPIYLFYSKNDWISSYWDVQKLSKKLPNVRGRYLVTDKKFNHLDYLFGIDAPKVLYSRILSLLTGH